MPVILLYSDHVALTGRPDGRKNTLDDLTSASSLSDIQSTLGTAKSELENMVSSITNTLSC